MHPEIATDPRTFSMDKNRQLSPLYMPTSLKSTRDKKSSPMKFGMTSFTEEDIETALSPIDSQLLKVSPEERELKK